MDGDTFADVSDLDNKLDTLVHLGAEPAGGVRSGQSRRGEVVQAEGGLLRAVIQFDLMVTLLCLSGQLFQPQVSLGFGRGLWPGCRWDGAMKIL